MDWKLHLLIKTESPTVKLPGKPRGFGYGDEGVLYNAAGEEVWRGPMRGWPNPFEPGTGTAWPLVYGVIAPGEYPFHFGQSSTNGPSLFINKKKQVAARYPNVNQNGERKISLAAVHTGALRSKNPDWPGSRGCITVPKSHADAFFSLFHEGDTGTIVIEDMVEVPVSVSTPPEKPLAQQAFSKPLLASKTVWLNALAIGGAALLQYTETLQLPEGTMLAIIAVLNIAVRLVTKRPVIRDKQFEDWVINLMLTHYDIDTKALVKTRKKIARRSSK